MHLPSPWRLAAAAATIAITITACGPTDSEYQTPASGLAETSTPGVPAVPDSAPTPEEVDEAEYVAPTLWETAALDPSSVILDLADDYFASVLYRPEGTVLQTHSEDGEILETITLDGAICGALTLGTATDGVVLTGATSTTPAEGLHPATERHAIVAYDPATLDVSWATEIPDVKADDDCFGLPEGAVSATGEWVSLRGGPWTGRAIRVADGHLSEPFSGMLRDTILPLVGDFIAQPTEDSGTEDWKVIDPATGVLQYLTPNPARGVNIAGIRIISTRSHESAGIDPETGQELWHRTGRYVSSLPLPHSDTVLFTPETDGDIEGVTAIDLTDPSNPREAYTLPTREVCGVTDGKAVVIVGDQVVVVDAHTGEQLDYTTMSITSCGAGLVGHHLITEGGVTRVIE